MKLTCVNFDMCCRDTTVCNDTCDGFKDGYARRVNPEQEGRDAYLRGKGFNDWPKQLPWIAKAWQAAWDAERLANLHYD